MIKTINKEALRSNVHRNPAVKVACIGDSARTAMALMVKEGIEDVGFICYDKLPLTEETIRNDFLDAHFLIVMGTDDDAALFNSVGHISRSNSLLTVGLCISSAQPCPLETDAFDTLFLTPVDQLVSSNQSASDFLNLACAGLAEVLGYKQRLTIDFCDIKYVLTQKGQSAIGVGTGVGSNRAVNAVNSALAQPTFAGADFNTARGALLILKASSQIFNSELRPAVEALGRAERKYLSAHSLSDEATCLVTVVEGGNFADELRATIVVTGMS